MLLEEVPLGSVFAVQKLTAAGLLTARADVIWKVTQHCRLSDFFPPHSIPTQELIFPSPVEPTVYLT